VCGHCGKTECPEKKSHSIISDKLLTGVDVIAALAKLEGAE
jgi:hypothetical protein